MNRTYKVYNNKIKEPIKLFLISDLHYNSKKDIKKYSFIIEELEKDKPEFLCIAGDLIDRVDIEEPELIINFIKECSKYTKVIIGIGNHDVASYHQKPVFDENQSFWNKLKNVKNVVVLDNSSYETNELYFYGLTFPFSYYYRDGEDYKVLLSYLEDKKYDFNRTNKLNILLVHSPIAMFNINARDNISFLKDIDISLSGHTHNGLVPRILEPIFKNRGIVSPTKKDFPKLVRGRFKYNETEVIISGGVTKLSKRSGLDKFDCFWAHELTKITILPKI